MKGVDVSIWNEDIDWAAVRAAGMDFAICRTGDGLNYADETFQRNVEGAHRAGLICGAYHYSRALTTDKAAQEAILVKKLIDRAGVLLELPVFFDIEDDDYKKTHGFSYKKRDVTKLCKAFLDNINLNAGIYANFDWFDRLIDWQSLFKEYLCPIWSAQWSNNDYLQGYMWQFTDKYKIAGKTFDANILYDEIHKAGLNPWN